MKLIFTWMNGNVLNSSFILFIEFLSVVDAATNSQILGLVLQVPGFYLKKLFIYFRNFTFFERLLEFF